MLAVQVVYEPSSGPHGSPARKSTGRWILDVWALWASATCKLTPLPHETKGPRPAAIGTTLKQFWDAKAGSTCSPSSCERAKFSMPTRMRRWSRSSVLSDGFLQEASSMSWRL